MRPSLRRTVLITALSLGLLPVSEVSSTELEVIEWDLAFPGIEGGVADALDILRAAKVVLGQAIALRSPKERVAGLVEAQRLFREVLAGRRGLTEDQASETEQFLNALEDELRDADTGEATRLTVAVVTVSLEDEIAELDEDRFYEMQKRIDRTIPDKAKARVERIKAYRRCLRNVRVRSKWRGSDDASIKRAVVEASRILLGWSDGRIGLEFAGGLLRYPETVSMRANEFRKKRRTLLEEERTWERGVGPALALYVREKVRSPFDLVVIVAKYDAQNARIPSMDALVETKRAVAPLLGRIPVISLAMPSVEERTKKADGADTRIPLGRRMAESIYGALRRAIAEVSGKRSSIRSLLPSPMESPVRAEERDVFFRNVFSVKLPRKEVSRLQESRRVFEQAETLSLESGSPELVDFDIGTSRPIRPGASVGVRLRRACRTRGFGLVLDHKIMDKDKRPRRMLEVEMVTGSARYRFRYPSRLERRIPYRVELPEVIDVKEIRIVRPSDDAKDRILIGEVVLFKI